MEMALSENIRSFRKLKHLTQEQFAEVLGVTAGAVYKWESGLSVPELELILEMADFFDLSVDALLGYRMKDNREKALIDRLNGYLRTHDAKALSEAEKALKRYPNSFKVVYTCAHIYKIAGSETNDRALLYRALELLEASRSLIRQNRDPEINETMIQGHIAGTYTALGDYEKGVQILKENNAGGIFNEPIGTDLAIFMNRPEEAEPYLSQALLDNAFGLFNSIIGYAFVFLAGKEYGSAREILNMAVVMLAGIRKEAKTPDFLDALHAVLLILLGHADLAEGKRDEAAAALRKAAEAAARFDAMPDYGFRTIRLISVPQKEYAYFGFGRTAFERIEFLMDILKDEELNQLWQEAGYGK